MRSTDPSDLQQGKFGAKKTVKIVSPPLKKKSRWIQASSILVWQLSSWILVGFGVIVGYGLGLLLNL